MELTLLMRLKDLVTSPLNRVNQHVGNVANHMRHNFHDMGIGVAGLWGSQHLTKQLLDPAIEYSRAERAVKSLGASKTTLQALGDIAMRSSAQFGMGAAHIVESAYAIQGGMGAALTEGALPRIANAADVMAKAVRTSNETATSYVASTYGVFAHYANKMGQAKFAERLAGQTALAVRTYRTTGQEMASAFVTMGSTGSANGQSLESQMAILGNLQSMGLTGSVAGTQYEQFLTSIKGAGKTLGMSFTNSDGSLQDIMMILSRLQQRFGDLSKIKDQNLLKKALGSDVAVKFLLNILNKLPKLKQEISQLHKVSDLSIAEEMAKDQVIGWDRLKQSITNISLAIGQGLNPALEPLSHKLANLLGLIARGLHDFPNIARWIGYTTMAITGFTAASAGLLVLKGFSQLVGFGTLGKDITLLKLLWKLFARFTGIELIISLFNGLIKIWQLLRTVGLALYLSLKMVNIGLIASRISMIALTTWGALCTTATWAWGIATTFLAGAMQILLSPITLTIMAIAALAAGVYYAITHWQQLKMAMMDSTIFQTVSKWAITLGQVFIQVWQSIKAGWQSLLNGLIAGYNWIVEKLNTIPGVEISTIETLKTATPESLQNSQVMLNHQWDKNAIFPQPTTPLFSTPAPLPALPNASRTALPQKGLNQTINNTKHMPQVDQSRNIQTVNIHVEQMPTPNALYEYQEMAAG